MAKLEISHIEWHVAHACNFTCEGCAHFSNHDHKGVVDKETLIEWYKPWTDRLLPKEIDLLGGEPLLNKDILEIIKVTKTMWPDSQIRLVTNGVLLHKYPDLPKVLKQTDTILVLSTHGDNDRYNQIMEDVQELVDSWIVEYGIRTKNFDSYNVWMNLYKGYGDQMQPFEDDDPEQSWENCITGQDCFQLFEGKIYKCSPLAYLQIQKHLYKLSDKWDHYLTYQPLTAECSDQQLVEFFSRQAESFCSMCPSNPEYFHKKNPLLPRKYYKLSIVND